MRSRSSICPPEPMWRSKSSSHQTSDVRLRLMNGLIGRKLGMTRLFDDAGTHVPVTVIEAGPCPVVQVTEMAVQLGFGAKKLKRSPKALLGHVKRAGLETAPRVLHSFPVAGGAEAEGTASAAPKPGEAVTVA